MAVEVYIHKMTEHMDRARIIGWRVREGDPVEKHQIIMDVETEKAAVELEAPASGIIRGIRKGAEAGAEVPVGEPLAYIAAPGETIPSLPPLGSEAGPVSASGNDGNHDLPFAEGQSLIKGSSIRATPIARKLAKDLKIDLGRVQGRGPHGRIREDDVRAYAAGQVTTLAEQLPAAAALPQVLLEPDQPPAPAAVEWLDLTSVQRLTGERMVESARSAPQLALELSVDVSNLLWLRRTLGGEEHKISVTAFLVKAAAVTLGRHPRVNAAFHNGRVQLFQQANIGIAVGTENGLVVPVIQAAGQKTVGKIQQEIEGFQELAAALRFPPAVLEGGTFTISNLGMFGIERFQAILNPPQSAILAVGKIIKTPVALEGDTVGLRPVMHLSLTIDHRVLDGLQGAKFLTDLKHSLETLSFLVWSK